MRIAAQGVFDIVSNTILTEKPIIDWRLNSIFSLSNGSVRVNTKRDLMCV